MRSVLTETACPSFILGCLALDKKRIIFARALPRVSGPSVACEDCHTLEGAACTDRGIEAAKAPPVMSFLELKIIAVGERICYAALC